MRQAERKNHSSGAGGSGGAAGVRVGKQTLSGQIRRRPRSVTRGEFVQELGRDGGAINVHELGRALHAALAEVGIAPEELARIAGRDGQIRGAAELRRLFRLVDRVDRDGNPRTLEARAEATEDSDPEIGASDESATPSGELYEALREEAEQYRKKAKRRGIIHVGMREPSRREVRALERGARDDGGVHAIDGYSAYGTIELGGERYDLTTEAGLDGLREALASEGISSSQAARLAQLLAGQSHGGRDDLARLGLALFKVGTGELAANRLVLSGHSSGESIFSLLGTLSFEALGELTTIFPEGAAKLEHVAVAACQTGYTRQVDQFRTMFPNLKSYLGYSGFAPKAEKGAPRHLRRWERMTDGEDPSRVDSIPNSNGNTWNVADGYQGPKEKVDDLEDSLRSQREAWLRYERGERVPRPGRPDPALDSYYSAITRLLGHRDLDPSRRAELREHRDEVLDLRREML